MILPATTRLTEPYWEGARAGQLMLQSCDACDATWHPPLPSCPECAGDRVAWRRSRGEGTVHSFTVVQETPDPDFADRCPLVIALVRLTEGPLVIANLLDCDPAEVQIDAPVRVCFVELTPEIALPQFRLDPGGRVRPARGDDAARDRSESGASR